LRGERIYALDIERSEPPRFARPENFRFLFIANLSAHSRVVCVSRANELARQPRGTTRHAFDRSIFFC
jgi:hypothetical protein